MDLDSIKNILGIVGFSAIGTGVILKIFLQKGIEEAITNTYKKEFENHNFLLKNSEKVFQFKLEASKSLYRILYAVIPKQSRPDMDWDEACEDIAASFHTHEEMLSEFLCEYQSTLSPQILKRVRIALSACSDGRFEFYWDEVQGEAIFNSAAKERASELYQALNEAVDELRNEIYSMISPEITSTTTNNKRNFLVRFFIGR